MAIGFGLVVLAMIAVALLVVRSQEADALVDHTFEVQSTAQSLLSQVQAAENGQRGFLITGDEDYLKRFAVALARVPELSASLRTLTADNPRQQTRLDRLEPLIKARLDRIQRTIDLVKKDGRDGAFDIVKGGEGKTLMDSIVAELPVLYTTGYTRNAIVHQGRLDPDVHLLNKPFTQRDLARKLRELLDAAETRDERFASRDL